MTSISKRGKDKSIIYLNLVVAFLILNYLQVVLIDSVFKEVNYFVRTLRIPFYALILPAFYTFVTYYLNVETKIKKFVLISVILFLIEIVFRVVFYFQFYNDNENYIIAQYRQIEEIINISFSLFLFVKAFLLLFKRQNLYPVILTFDNLNWLKKFMVISTFIMGFWLVAVIFNLDKVLHPSVKIFYPLRFMCSFLILWLGYVGFRNYSLLYERIQLRTDIHKKVQNNPLVLNEKFSIIKNQIESNTNYLNPHYSLEQLSSELKMSVSSLSQTINKESNSNFSDYINALRVEKAKLLLVDKEFENYTILSIGLECGFNSKSTFYLAFKKFTQTTPTEFRLKNS